MYYEKAFFWLIFRTLTKNCVVFKDILRLENVVL